MEFDKIDLYFLVFFYLYFLYLNEILLDQLIFVILSLTKIIFILLSSNTPLPLYSFEKMIFIMINQQNLLFFNKFIYFIFCYL